MVCTSLQARLQAGSQRKGTTPPCLCFAAQKGLCHSVCHAIALRCWPVPMWGGLWCQSSFGALFFLGGAYCIQVARCLTSLALQLFTRGARAIPRSLRFGQFTQCRADEHMCQEALKRSWAACSLCMPCILKSGAYAEEDTLNLTHGCPSARCTEPELSCVVLLLSR